MSTLSNIVKDKNDKVDIEAFLSSLSDGNESYRDSIATVNEKGKRIWLFPKQTSGKWTNYRNYVAYALIALWIIGPFLSLNGDPLMLFNIIDRHFVILGQHFYPQDLAYFGGLLLSFFIFIALFTLTYGRVWCGWACPQTLFMEHIFRKIEFWIEGTAAQQRALKTAPWSVDKLKKRFFKHSIYVLFSLSTTIIILMYVFVKTDVFEWFAKGVFTNIPRVIFTVLFTGVFYLVFSWFREQVCIAICPYGRLQSVLLGNGSLQVIYNKLRGEPRRPKRKTPNTLQHNALKFEDIIKTEGDCIDCSLCVQVCPTGIDIRNGSQLECINCTACIDACNTVMDKIGKPKELITLNSYENIAQQKPWRPNKKTWLLTAAMLTILLIDGVLLASRKPVVITILRVPGQLYQKVDEQHISNLYNLQMVNKTNKAMHFKAAVENGSLKIVAGSLDVPAQGHIDVTLFITKNKKHLTGRKTELSLTLTDSENRIYSKKTNFLAP